MITQPVCVGCFSSCCCRQSFCSLHPPQTVPVPALPSGTYHHHLLIWVSPPPPHPSPPICCCSPVLRNCEDSAGTFSGPADRPLLQPWPGPADRLVSSVSQVPAAAPFSGAFLNAAFSLLGGSRAGRSSFCPFFRGLAHHQAGRPRCVSGGGLSTRLLIGS